ncbi:MAG: hypothetical protein JSV84_07005 [Gemmatimonadota bacterium]|nr:MAG: hypothetical protein JSV84_07005 [Gemmatimonadota bacterium]
MVRTILFSALVCMILAGLASAQIPQTMSYQGMLKDDAGNPVADGTETMTFKLYDAEEEGTALWQEIREVEITDGLFHVILGEENPLSLPFDKPYWLGITVGTEEELAPRYALTSSPYSLNAVSTIVEPEAGQSLAIRNEEGEQTHILSQDGNVVHKGRGTFEGGLEVIMGDTTEISPSVKPERKEKIDSDTAITVLINEGAGVYASNNDPTLPAIFGYNISETGTAVGIKGLTSRGTGVLGSSDYGTGVKAEGDIGLLARGTGYAARFDGDVSLDYSGKLRIDNVTNDPQAEKILVWSDDKFVRYRALPSDTGDGHECGWDFDEESGIISTDHEVILKNEQGEVTAHFNTDVDEHLIRGRLEVDDWLIIENDESKGGITMDPEEFILFDSEGVGAYVFNEDSSDHFKPAYYYEDVILKGQDGKGIKLVNDNDETIAGFGRKDLDTGQILAVYGTAETENDLAGRFDGDVKVNGEIYASSLHIVTEQGDTLTDFNRDGTSTHRGLEKFEEGLIVPIKEADKAIVLYPDLGIAIMGFPGGEFYFHADPEGNAIVKEHLFVKNCTVSDVLQVQGTLSKPAGSFKIDHPLDPEGKFLYHSFVESPDMMNIYNGNVVLDEAGQAWVELPQWFDALNRDFRYQLAPIGAPGPNLYISEEIHNNRFKIAGGSPGMKVSWQVTGIRQDAYAEANRIQVEEDKPPEQRGTYLHPECFGKSESYRLSSQK